MKLLKDNQKGYALIIVLWIIVFLTIIFIYLADKSHLNNILVQESLNSKRLEEATISAAVIGINKLKQDKTDFDTKQDNWYGRMEGKLNSGKIKYNILIKDIGSRLNVNYTKKSILEEFNWWDSDLNTISEDRLLPDLLLIKEILGVNYPKAKNILTVYGKFNLNCDSIEGFKKLLQHVGTSEVQADIIANNLKEIRENDEEIEFINQLPIELTALDMITFEKLVPYITVKGKININLVSSEVLFPILQELEIGQHYGEKILSYREDNEISKLKDLTEIIPEEEYNKLKFYLTTDSSYFLMRVKVVLSDQKQIKEIEVIVKRSEREGKERKIKVLKWREL